MATSEAPEDLQFGVARLQMRTGLDDFDSAFVPSWDDKFQINEAMFESIAVCAQDDFPGLLVGPPGCGKSTSIQAIAALLNQPCRRVNLHGDLRVADFVGTKVLAAGKDGQRETVWRDGILPAALRRGHWLILDEWDACPPEIAFIMQGVLEPGHALVLTDNFGEIVHPHHNFRIFATANTIGKGDDAGLFAGTHIQNEATLDRFCVVAVDYLPATEEAKVVAEKGGIDLAVATLMVAVARDVREGFRKTECACSLSTRRLIAWAILTRRFLGAARSMIAWKTAEARSYRMAIGGKLGPEDAVYVAGIVQRHMAINVK